MSYQISKRDRRIAQSIQLDMVEPSYVMEVYTGQYTCERRDLTVRAISNDELRVLQPGQRVLYCPVRYGHPTTHPRLVRATVLYVAYDPETKAWFTEIRVPGWLLDVPICVWQRADDPSVNRTARLYKEL